MTISLLHNAVASEPDDGVSEVGSDEWNEEHVIEMATARMLGRITASTGVVEELTKANVLTFLNVEDGADVTDTANVTAAGALMDSEVDADIKTLSLPASTTISAFGATLVDDANAAAGATTLGLGTGDTPQFTGIELGHASDTTIARVSAGLISVEGSNVLMASGVGSIVQGYDADTLKADTDDVLTAGFACTSVDDGTKSSGTYTPTYVGGNYRDIVNGGAFTLAAPSATGDFYICIQVTNNGSAGTITLSGFEAENGDSLSTVNGDDFLLHITKHNGFQSIFIEALQ